MPTAKEEIQRLIASLLDDATYEDAHYALSGARRRG